MNIAKTYKKNQSEEMASEEFERKSYMKDLRMNQARMKFRINTKMFNYVKLNFKNDPQECESPECSYLDSQEHVLWCEEYTDLRTNKDLSRDTDLTTYYQQVMKMREKKDNK